MHSYEGQYEWVDTTRTDGILTLTWRTRNGKPGTGVEMARYSEADDTLTIFPRIKDGGRENASMQFSRIQRFVIPRRLLPAWRPDLPVDEGVNDPFLYMPGLPEGFGRTFRYGLGLRREYRTIIEVIENNSRCTAVCFVGKDEPEGVASDGAVYALGISRFEEFVSLVKRNQARARRVAARVNAAEAHNAVAPILALEPAVVASGRNPVIRAMTREVQGTDALSDDERRMLLRRTASEAGKAAVHEPALLSGLRRDIELVTLKELIERFDFALTGHQRSSESAWQLFFENNVFALQQLFAVPVALIGTQLTVRASDALGRGARRVDFLLVNTASRSLLVVEIKTPTAKLVGKSYRGRDDAAVFLPHEDLTGAVVQVQSQIESVRTEMPKLPTHGVVEIDSYSVRGAIIVGNTEQLSPEEKASYLRFRSGLTQIEVLAFDEVRDRLRILGDVLSDRPTAGS